MEEIFLSEIWEQRFEWNGEEEFRDCSMLECLRWGGRGDICLAEIDTFLGLKCII